MGTATVLYGSSMGGGGGSISTPVSVSDGGTGLTSITANKLVKGNGTSAAVVTGINVGSNDDLSGFRGEFNDQTGTTYTLVSGDNGKVITLTNASAITLELPNSLPKGFNVLVIQGGAGQVTLSALSGATLRNRSSHTKMAGQYAQIGLVVTANSGGSAAVYNMGGDTA